MQMLTPVEARISVKRKFSKLKLSCYFNDNLIKFEIVSVRIFLSENFVEQNAGRYGNV